MIIWYNKAVRKRDGPGGALTPRSPDHREEPLWPRRILQDAVSSEVQRNILRKAEDRYHNELMSDEERQLLLDRIRRIRRQLRLV